ncbi:MAG TPA: pyridoxal phosphate-dependent aminotransferase [Steroidobacteraceae bacterium]|nr:pyridoxal phosphate-dependent aminotransferase [Steroidobacteraceae bacterium]
MRFSALVERIAGEGADAWVTHYEARRARERGEDVILLSVGDPDFDTPNAVRERAIECIRAGDTHYTPASGRQGLREAIAALHLARSGQAVSADQVVVLSGAQNALFCASLCLAGPGDEVIAVEPMYPTYPATLEVSGARLVRGPALPEEGFRIDLQALERAVTPRTRAVFFATPNNPSGGILSEEDLATIGDLARRHSLWIVADEVYAGLAPGGRVPSLAARLPDRVVTIGSLSKSHAMTGWRAGWLVGPRALAVHVESLVMCMLFGLPGFIQEAAITALGIAPAAEAQIRDYCRSRRELLLAELGGARGLSCCAPDAGMFILIDVRRTGLSGYQFMRGLYESERVSVIDGGAFGRQTGGFVRICFAAEEAVLREACARIKRFAASLPLAERQGAGRT